MQETDVVFTPQDAITAPRTERDVIVPLIDEHQAGRIYDPSIHRYAFWTALGCGLLVGWIGFAVAEGGLAIAGLGQWAVSGAAVGAVTGGGIGLAIGGFVGAVVALYRLPARHPEMDQQE